MQRQKQHLQQRNLECITLLRRNRRPKAQEDRFHKNFLVSTSHDNSSDLSASKLTRYLLLVWSSSPSGASACTYRLLLLIMKKKQQIQKQKSYNPSTDPKPSRTHTSHDLRQFWTLSGSGFIFFFRFRFGRKILKPTMLRNRCGTETREWPWSGSYTRVYVGMEFRVPEYIPRLYRPYTGVMRQFS